jgi:hypothetical protein
MPLLEEKEPRVWLGWLLADPPVGEKQKRREQIISVPDLCNPQ